MDVGPRPGRALTPQRHFPLSLTEVWDEGSQGLGPALPIAAGLLGVVTPKLASLPSLP